MYADDVLPLDRASTAERAADVLRDRITEGELRPGSRLSEESLVAVLGVSRNTLRESFRLLCHEGLLVHLLHRGVFVPVLDEQDVLDLFRLRRTIERDVVRTLGTPDDLRLRPLRDAVATAEAAAAAGRWAEVGTANMRFHTALVGLAGSRRFDDLIRRLLAELRLALHAVDGPRNVYGPYVERNRQLVDLLAAGDTGGALDHLDRYLRDSEDRLLAALRPDAAAPVSDRDGGRDGRPR